MAVAEELEPGAEVEVAGKAEAEADEEMETAEDRLVFPLPNVLVPRPSVPFEACTHRQTSDLSIGPNTGWTLLWFSAKIRKRDPATIPRFGRWVRTLPSSIPQDF